MDMNKEETPQSSIFFLSLLAYFGSFLAFLGAEGFFAQQAWGQLRTPQGQFYQLKGLSPLNDNNYFKVLMSKYSKNPNELKQKKKFKKIELFGLKTIIRPVATGKKILAPSYVDLQNPYLKKLNSTIPGNLGPSQNESEVLKRFGDQAIQNWLNSPDVRNSSFGKAASQVESAMKVEASIQSAPSVPGQAPIDHKFSFQYLALQSLTKVEYKGWTNAQFRIDSGKSETAMEISERVFRNKDLVVSHIKNPTENHSSMGLRWSW
jgi:hypothetical protein